MDEEIKKLENLDMLDLAMAVSLGGFHLCRARTWGAKDECYDYAKLYYPVSGSAWIRMNGKHTKLKPRQLYLIPPGHPASYGTTSTFGVYWLHFYPQAILLQRRLADCPGVICFRRDMRRRWAPTCRLIPRFMDQGDTGDACRIHSMLLEILSTVLGGLPDENLETRAAYERLRPAVELLERATAAPPGLTELAEKVSLSAEHFHRLFRKAFHTTPLRLALRHRMNLAQQLLSEGRLTVTEVAARCGFDDAFYFSKVFRRYFGVTPKKVSQGRALVTMP